MRSVIQEESSLAKAIEQGWIKAGKPKEFSVKIFEEPEKNFFGFTSKPAKVGIFFKDVASSESRQDGRDNRYGRPHRRRPSSHVRRQQQGQSSDRPRVENQPPQAAKPAQPNQPAQQTAPAVEHTTAEQRPQGDRPRRPHRRYYNRPRGERSSQAQGEQTGNNRPEPKSGE